MNIGGVPQTRLPQRPVVKAGGPTDGVQPTYAPQPTTYVQQQPTQPAQNNVQPMANILANVFSGIVNFLKSFFGAIANMFKGAGNTGTTPGSTTPVPAPLDPSQAAIAQQYNLLPTPENVQAFLAEVQKYQADGALGPGSNNQGAIRDLQGALARLGYQLPQTGTYDQATAQAVMAFKQANGLRQTYKSKDGNFAVNEYAETQTLQLIMQKLQALMTQQPPVQQPPVQQPPVQQPPVQQPPVQQPPVQQPGQPNYGAIAQQYNLLNSPENVQAFLAEVQRYQSEGALGPGSTNQGAIRDLQGALARLGYQLPQTGTYDQATAQAVMAFKQASGLRQTYKSADGNFAVNEYAETQTLQLIMQKLQAMMTQQQPAPQPAPQPQPPVQQPTQQPAPQPGQPNYAAIAQQYRIQASPENVQAFLNEVKQYQTDGALGPGSTQTQAINDLQTVLQKWGFQVTPNGQFDQATQAAVIEYKKRNGLHQSYRAQDGNFAVNEYADKQTLEHIMRKLEAEMKKAG